MFKFLRLAVYLFLVSSVAVAAVFAAEIDPSKVNSTRAQLEAELAQIEAQIEKESAVIQEKQRQSTTLERDIAILDAQISKSKLEIKARDITIANLNDDINEHSETIGVLSQKLDEEKQSLSELLRRVDELDEQSLVEVLLSYDKLSDFFSNFDSFESIQKELQASFNEIKGNKTKTEKEKEDLDGRKSEQVQLRAIQELERKRIEQQEASKKNLLKVTKGEEKKYQAILTERKKNAAAIRSQLFLLRGSPSIPFEKAVQYANVAYKATGVRPAFLLGIISEESELGANVGTGNWRTDLYECYKRIGYPSSAEKQKTAFMQITGELGLNPDSLPVSKAPYYGCGGAMGPAQFMPTTWQLYKVQIGQMTGHDAPSPWDPLDAFMGSALLLKDNGATSGRVSAERRAALRYLAGSNWNKPAYSFYGDDVMALAQKYQEQIDIISR
ncbi:MAG: lytic murein transglycosylase [bacterium]|nr:lytic murein transglycosylase [bacterium]